MIGTKFRQLALLLFGLLTLTACGSTMNTKDFEAGTPSLKLEEYFNGKTTAYGMFEDRFGTVRNQFVVDIDGSWDGETLILDEDFVYNDGSKENRRWVLKKTGPNTFEGTTENVIGVAKGVVAGNSFNWKYKFNLTVGDSVWKVAFDDWMFLQPNGVLLNKATVTRWGFKIGTVFLSFYKDGQQPEIAANGQIIHHERDPKQTSLVH